MTDLPRGIRNHNPGNLDYLPPPRSFLGQIGVEIVPPGESYKPRFGRYDTPHNGLRALAKQILIDNQHHDLKTVRQIIASWAPAGDDNDTPAYIRDIAATLGIGPDDTVDVRTGKVGFLLTKGIVRQENGVVPYTDVEILAAVGDAFGGVVTS